MENNDSQKLPLGLGYFLLPPHPGAGAPPRPPRPQHLQSQPFDFRNLGASFCSSVLQDDQPSKSANSGKMSPNSSVTDDTRTLNTDDEDCREDSPDISFNMGDPGGQDPRSPTELFSPRSGSKRHHDLAQWPVNLGIQFINPSTGKKRVQCNVCLKTFCDKGALKIHFSAVHLREMHKCTVEGCTMMFSSRRSRNRHSANPNPKLHSPHTRRKISAHDGRSSQPFTMLPGPRPLPLQLPLLVPDRLPVLPHPAMPNFSDFEKMYRNSAANDEHNLRDITRTVSDNSDARKEEEKIQKLANINKFLADYQKYGQDNNEKTMASEVINADEPEDLSMPSKRSSSSVVEVVEHEEPHSVVDLREIQKPAVTVPNKRKRKSEKPTRCSQSVDMVLSDEDMSSELYRTSEINEAALYKRGLNNNTFHVTDEPVSFKISKVENALITPKDVTPDIKKEIDEAAVGSPTPSNRSSGEKIRLRSDLYGGAESYKNEFPRDALSLVRMRSPPVEAAEEILCHPEELNALEIPIDEENPDKCTACGQIFQNHFLLRIHFRNVHLKLLHQCDIDGCNAAFPSKRSRDRHSSNMSLHRKLLSTCSPDRASEQFQTRPAGMGFDADLLNRLYADIKGLASTLETLKYNPYGSESVPSLPVFVSEAVQQYWMRAGAGIRDARSPLSASSPPAISPRRTDPPSDEDNLLFRESSDSIRRMTSLCERQEQIYQHHVPVS